jgi:Flavin containing amine oxidoreductase
MPGGRLPPLARAMREYARLDSGAREAGGRASCGDALERAERGVLSRRGLLRAGGAFGVSAALAACTAPSSPARSPSAGSPRAGVAQGARVVVVGAGLAGITAAYRLAQNGVQVRLYEARDRIGGRCWTARGFGGGQTAEHGGEFIDTRHVHLRALAAELRLQLDDLWQGDVAGSVSPSWINGRYFAGTRVDAALKRISAAAAAQARRIGVTGANGKSSDAAYSYGTATAGARQMDELSMREWIDQHVPGIPGNVKTFLDQTMSGWYGLDMAGLSALNWIDFLVIPYPGGDERWHVRHGNDQVPALAARALPAGTTRLGSPLQAVIRRPGGTYELRFSGSAALDHATRRRPGRRRLQQLPDDGHPGTGHGNQCQADPAVQTAAGHFQGARRAMERDGQLRPPELLDLGQRAHRAGHRGPDHGLYGRLRQHGVREPGPSCERTAAPDRGDRGPDQPGRSRNQGSAQREGMAGLLDC